MSKLTTGQRKSMPSSKFAGPDRTYPVPDKSHAANAKARASQAVNDGRMSKAAAAKIDAKADRVLGEKESSEKRSMPKSDASYGGLLHRSPPASRNTGKPNKR